MDVNSVSTNPISAFKNFTQQLENSSHKQRLIPGTDNYFIPLNAGDSRGKATLANTFEFAATRVEEFTAQINERNFSATELREFQKSCNALRSWNVNVFKRHLTAKYQRENAKGSLFYRIISLFSSLFAMPYNTAVEKQNNHLTHSLARFEYHMMLKIRLNLLHLHMQSIQSEIDYFFDPVDGKCKKTVEEMAAVENLDVKTVIDNFAFFTLTFNEVSKRVQTNIPSSLVTEETIHVGKLGIAQKEEIAKLQGYRFVLSHLASAAFDMRHSIEGDRQKCQLLYIKEKEVEGHAMLEAQYLKIQNTPKPTFPLKVELKSSFLSASVEVHDLAELEKLEGTVKAMASELENFGNVLQNACVYLSHLESILREGKQSRRNKNFACKVNI
jgi:hypothetical protein